MTKTAPNPNGSFLTAFMTLLTQAIAITARVLTGVLLIATASIVAVMTAFVGVILALAALAMRYTSKSHLRPMPATGEAEPVTLDARPTPRGWTVE